MVGACQQNSGIFLVRGSGLGAGDLRCQAAVPATKSHGQAADSERPGTGRDTGGDRGLGRDKMPATKSHGQVADSERPGAGRDTGGGRG